MNSKIVLLFVALVLISWSSAARATTRVQLVKDWLCKRQAAVFLARADLSEPLIRRLVDKMRQNYQFQEFLTTDAKPSDRLVQELQSLRSIGSTVDVIIRSRNGVAQDSCRRLEEYLGQMGSKVPCTESMNMDQNCWLDIVRMSPRASRALEANLACELSE